VPKTAKKSAKPRSGTSTGESRALKEILKRLKELQPKVRKIPVEELTDGKSSMRFLDVDAISFITTESADPSFELMFALRDGRRYFANGSLVHFERELEDNPYWLRTSQKYLVNLNAIERSRISRARDLMLEGQDGWIENAVSPNSDVRKYLDEFKNHFITSV